MTHKQLCKVYIASCDQNGGIFLFDMDEDGRLYFLSKTDLDWPMYMAIHNNTFFALLRSPFEGVAESGLVSLEIAKDGSLSQNGEILSTKGEVACHLTVDDDGIFCANYVSGSVIKMPDRVVAHKGSSIHPTRQTSAHTHQVIFTPDQRYVCVTDLGLDKIFIYDKDMNFIRSADVPKGHGARHLVFSIDGAYAYCANELASTVTVFDYCDGRLEQKNTFSTLPNDFLGDSTVAAIRISEDGKFLYVSNRGHDSIACFNVQGDQLKLFEIVSCNGKSPRDFNITPNGKFLVCTNEVSDSVTLFSISNGRLNSLDEQISIKNPLCVIFGEERDMNV